MTRSLIYIAAGGVIFWIPEVILSAAKPEDPTLLGFLILTWLLPLITLGCFAVLWKVCGRKDSRAVIGRLMLLGIWLAGPLFMSIGWSFSGVGLAQRDGLKLVLMGTLLFPVFTSSMSAYDGTLFALLLTTFVLVLISEGSHLKFFKRLRLT